MKIHCPICQDWIDKSELKKWSGDDRRHFLCPGCDSDLLPSKPSLDKELDDESEFMWFTVKIRIDTKGANQ